MWYEKKKKRRKRKEKKRKKGANKPKDCGSVIFLLYFVFLCDLSREGHVDQILFSVNNGEN